MATLHLHLTVYEKARTEGVIGPGTSGLSCGIDGPQAVVTDATLSVLISSIGVGTFLKVRGQTSMGTAANF